jgi:hypothetical protein
LDCAAFQGLYRIWRGRFAYSTAVFCDKRAFRCASKTANYGLLKFSFMNFVFQIWIQDKEKKRDLREISPLDCVSKTEKGGRLRGRFRPFVRVTSAWKNLELFFIQ